MNDYEPFDLSPFCNAGPEVFDPDPDPYSDSRLDPAPPSPPIGSQTFHGLPFLIGSAGGSAQRCFIALGEGTGLAISPIRVEIKRKARWLVFAHTILTTRLFEGGPAGVVVATFEFAYRDGSKIEVPIRERFEAGNLPLPWGHYPFLSVPDEKDSLKPRYHGDWESFGWRLAEAGQGWPQAYFLWPWQNPFPDLEIETLTVGPGGQKYLLAAITLGHLEERPISRHTRRPVKISLNDPQAADRPFDLEIDVDRGVATYPYPLPARPLDVLRPEMAGFGAPFNRASSPAYSEIAAIPSATVVVRQGGRELGRGRWGEIQEKGSVESGGVRIEMIDPGKNWVHVSVRDRDTGQKVPCRVAFHSPEGVPYPPHGHHAPVFSNIHTWNMDVGGDVRLGQIAYAYIDGSCQGWLPRGRVLVDVARGFEYEPLRAWVEIAPGQQRLDLEIGRWIDMNAEGCYSGDSHVHFVSTQGGQLEASGEDLNVVNLLLSQWGHYFSNTEEFTGRPNVSPDGRTIVYASQENRQHILGHLTLLGLKTPVMPWGSGGPSEAELGGSLDITMSHWADMCRAQGGTVILPHIPTPNGEPAAMIATGRVDAVEFLEHQRYEHLEYYRYLNGGYRLPIVGGTDKMSQATPVGLYRTYVYLAPDQEFTYENWCAGLGAGRTFMSGGALIWFTVEGQPIGSTVAVRGGGTVEVEAHARSIFPLHTLQIVQGGRVVAQSEAGEGSGSLELKASLKVDSDTWLAARCGGPGYSAAPHHDRRERGIFAHTSPVYLACGSDYDLFEPATGQYMLTMIEGSLAYIREASPQYPPELVSHHHGEADHIAYLEAPFLEAREALHRRMHRLGLAH